MRTLFVTIYSAGLRVSEAVALTCKDIDSANMVIHVRHPPSFLHPLMPLSLDAL
jgi:site-specific recombinase XerD